MITHRPLVRLTVLIWLPLLFFSVAYGQEPADSLGQKTIADSLLKAQNARSIADTLSPVADSLKAATWQQFFGTHPFLPLQAEQTFQLDNRFAAPTAEPWFYGMLAAIFFLAVFRMVFPKYFSDIFLLFRKSSMQQKALKEQLTQATLPSLLLNIFFALSIATFAFVVAKYKGWLPPLPEVRVWSALVIVVSAFYLAKYAISRLMGWMLQQNALADDYIFIVFLLNKTAGIMVWPAIWMLIFGTPEWKAAFFVLGLGLIAILLIYGYVVSYRLVRQHLNVLPLHFFIYLCAFEVVPVLLIFKWLQNHVQLG